MDFLGSKVSTVNRRSYVKRSFRAGPDTGRHQQRDKGNGIKKETKEMERTWAAIFSSIFTLFHVMH